MAYGPNILPTTGWTLVNASIVGGSLIFSAGGYASLVLTDIEGSNLLSDSLLLNIIASSFTSPYTPVAFVKIRIVYSDGGMFESTTPIVANKDGMLSIVLSPTVTNYTAINASSFSAIEITINSSAALTLTTWELCCSINNKVVTDADYYGIKITATDGLVITTADGAAQATFNAEELTMSATENGIMVDQIYFNPVSHKYTFRGTVIVNGGDVDDLFGAVNSDLESLEDSTVKKDTTYNGARIGPTYGFEAVLSNLRARAFFNSTSLKMQKGDGSGSNWEDMLYFDPTAQKYFFKGDVFGARFFAGSPLEPGSYVEMSSTGLRVYNAEGLLKIEHSFTSALHDYPFMALGAGSDTANSRGLFKKFADGLWVGNSAPIADNGNFVPTVGYNGIFFDFTENKAYVVNGTDIRSIYTGESVAKFG